MSRYLTTSTLKITGLIVRGLIVYPVLILCQKYGLGAALELSVLIRVSLENGFGAFVRRY